MNVRKRFVSVLLLLAASAAVLFWYFENTARGPAVAAGGSQDKAGTGQAGSAEAALADQAAAAAGQGQGTPATMAVAAPAVATAPGQGQQPDAQNLREIEDVPPMVKQQLAAISTFKDNWTPAQKKMDSTLIMLERTAKGLEAVPGARGFGPLAKPDEQGMVMIDLRGKITEELTQEIKALGGEVVNQVVALGALRAKVPADKTGLLAERADVTNLRLADKIVTNAGPVNTAGNVAHNANGARAGWAADGTGVRIGVLSDGVDGLALSQARGELPANVTVLQDGLPGRQEGTAMLEIIHDMAPGAELFFATADFGTANMAANIVALQQAGCDIIVDDVTYPLQPAYDDDEICDAVTQVCNQGVLYFSSAGNRGSLSRGTSGTYEAAFNQLGVLDINDNQYQVHRMSGTAFTLNEAFNQVTDTQDMNVILNWNDEMGFSASDYDLFMMNADNTELEAGSITVQDGAGDDPVEGLGGVPSGRRVFVARRAGEPARQLHLDLIRNFGAGTLQFSTAGSVRGHNAAVHANAFCVAAVAPPAAGTAYTGGTGVLVRNYSSDGPRRRYTYDGAHNPGAAVDHQKPDLTAIDGVQTSVGGFETFPGTSASAPHVAAMAALLVSYNPTLTPAQLRTLLTTAPPVSGGGSTVALDMETAGWDRNSGHGIIMPARSLAAAAASPGTSADTLFTVTTTDTLQHTGTQGGDFTARRGAFTLSNLAPVGGQQISWAAAEASPWIALSSSSGTLAPGATATVTYSLDGAGVSALTSNGSETRGYLAGLTFSRTGNANAKHATVALDVAPAVGGAPTFATEIEVRDGEGDLMVDDDTYEQDFGAAVVGASATMTWTIKNIGRADLTAFSTTIDGPDAALFSVSQQPGAPVQENGSTTVSVQFTPTTTGVRTARLVLASNDTDENPFEIRLKADGIITELVLEQPAGTELATGAQRYLGAASLNSVGTNFTKQMAFTVKNTASGTGAGWLHLEPSITGAAAGDYSVINLPHTLAPEGEEVFIVIFRPTVLGTRNAVLQINSTDADEGTVTINLTGLCVDLGGDFATVTSRPGWTRAAPSAQSAGGGALSAEKYLGTAYDAANSSEVFVMGTTSSTGIAVGQTTTDDFQFYGQETGNSNSTVTVRLAPAEMQGSNVLAGVTVRERASGDNLTTGLSGNRFVLAGVLKNGSTYNIKWLRRLTPNIAIVETTVAPAGFGVNSEIVLQVNRGTYGTGTNPATGYTARYMIRNKNVTTGVWPEWPATWTTLGTTATFSTSPAYTTSTFLTGISTSTNSSSDYAVAVFDQLRITGPGHMSYQYPRKFAYNPADPSGKCYDTVVDANDVVYHTRMRQHPVSGLYTLCLYKVVPNDDRVSPPVTSYIWPDPVIPTSGAWNATGKLTIDRLGDMYVSVYDTYASSSNYGGQPSGNKIFRIRTTETTTVAGLQTAPSELVVGVGSPATYYSGTRDLANPAAGDGGDPLAATIMPQDIAFDHHLPPGGSGRGRLYIADGYSMRLRRVDFDQNTINTVAGGGASVFPVSTTTTKPPVLKASALNLANDFIDGIAIDKASNVYLSYNCTIIRLTTPVTLTGSSPEAETGILGDAKVIAGNTGRSPNYGEVMVNDVDATKSTVEIYPLGGLSVDTNGHVYYLDYGYSPSTSSGATTKIRMVTPNGNRLITVAGNNSLITDNQYYNQDYTGPALSTFPLNGANQRPVMNSKGTLFTPESWYYYRWFW